MNNEQVIQIIDQYHNGSLSQLELESLFANTPGLKAAFEEYNKDLTLVSMAAKITFKKAAEKALKRHALKKKLLLTIIVSAIVASIFFVVKWNQEEEISPPQQLFAMHYSPMSVPTLRSNLSDVDEWTSYVKAYEKGQYQEVVKLFYDTNVASNTSNTDLAYLLLGISQMETKEYSAAFESLNKVSDESLYAQEKQWYSALFLLKSGMLSEAYSIFENIASTASHSKSKEAQEFVVSIQKRMNE